MKKVLFVLFILSLASLSHAISYLAFESITIPNVATKIGAGATTTNPAATCSLETAEIRFCVDGTTADATINCFLWEPGQERNFSRDEVSNFSAIRTGGVSGVLKCAYY